jgi:biotin carboxyl carrier protein
VIALYLQAVQRAEATILPRIPPGYRNNPFRDPSIRLEVAGDVYDVSLHHPGGDGSEVRCGDWKAAAEVVSFEPGRIRIKIDGVQQTYRIAYDGDRFFVNCPGREAVVTRLPRYPRALAASEHESASAPMPGQVLKILVDVGQEVLAGEPLVILEAMKMEQTLRASTGGVVEAVLVRQGDVVAPGDILVEIAAR